VFFMALSCSDDMKKKGVNLSSSNKMKKNEQMNLINDNRKQ